MQVIGDLFAVSSFAEPFIRAITKRKEPSLLFPENLTHAKEKVRFGGASRITVFLTILLFCPFS